MRAVLLGVTVACVGAGLVGFKLRTQSLEHEQRVVERALKAIEPISPQDEATIRAYNSMKNRWNEEVKKATNGEMNLGDIELLLMMSQMNNNSL